MLDAGVSQTLDFKGEPGKYAFFCFMADKKGGPPHVAKGMVSEVVVEWPASRGGPSAAPASTFTQLVSRL